MSVSCKFNYFQLLSQCIYTRVKSAKKAEAFLMGNGSSHQMHVMRYVPSCYSEIHSDWCVLGFIIIIILKFAKPKALSWRPVLQRNLKWKQVHHFQIAVPPHETDCTLWKGVKKQWMAPLLPLRSWCPSHLLQKPVLRNTSLSISLIVTWYMCKFHY